MSTHLAAFFLLWLAACSIIMGVYNAMSAATQGRAALGVIGDSFVCAACIVGALVLEGWL